MKKTTHNRITIRKGRPADIPKLVRLYSGVREIADFAGQAHDKGYFKTFLSSRNKIVLVAEYERKIVGALNAELEDKARYAFLNNMVVARKYRGMGAGGMLMNTLEKIARKKGINRMLGLVYVWNKNMQEIMKHYNYKSGRKTIIYSKGL